MCVCACVFLCVYACVGASKTHATRWAGSAGVSHKSFTCVCGGGNAICRRCEASVLSVNNRMCSHIACVLYQIAKDAWRCGSLSPGRGLDPPVFKIPFPINPLSLGFLAPVSLFQPRSLTNGEFVCARHDSMVR